MQCTAPRTWVYSVLLSRGQPLSRQAVCTRAAMYVSGMCSPEIHMTLGSPSRAQLWYWRYRLSNHSIHDPSIFCVLGFALAQLTGSWPL